MRDNFRILARATDFQWLLTHLHGTHGAAVDMGLGRRPPLRLTYVFGADANRFLLADGVEHFEWSRAYALTKFFVGETALLVSDGPEHARRRKSVQPAFSKRRIDSKLDMAYDEVDTMLDRWVPGSEVDAYAELRRTVRRISVRAMFGDGFGERGDEFGEVLAPAFAHFVRAPHQRVDVDLPFTSFGKAVRSRRAADAMILEEVARRRDQGGPTADEFDILSSLIAGDETTPDQPPLSDPELCDQVVSLIAAGYDTTSSAAAWLVDLLGRHPDHLDALRAEVASVGGDRRATIEDLRSMPTVAAVVSETLRLKPTAPVGLRIALDDVEVAGVSVPAGSMVVYSPYVTHRMPEYWDRPDEFDPTRWQGGEPEPYTYLPFGGGYRRCLGFALATLELQALAIRVAQRLSWEPVGPEPTSRSVANFAPQGGVSISVLDRQ